MSKVHLKALVFGAGCLLVGGCATTPRGGEGTAAVSQAQEEKVAAAHAHYAQGMIYEEDAEPDKALEEFSRAALADPSNEALVLDVARQYFQSQQVDKAVELLAKAATVPGASGGVFALLGEGYYRLGKYSQAMTAAKEAIKRDPRSLAGYEDLFVVNLQRNKPAEALQALDMAAKVPKPGAEYLIDLAAMYGGIQQHEPRLKDAAVSNGLAALDRAAAMDVSAPRIAIKLADTYDLLGRTTNAIQIYQSLLAKYGELPAVRDDLHAKLAVIYLRDGDVRKASTELQAIAADNPDNPQTYYSLGMLAYEAQQFPEAATYFQRALDNNSDFEQAYYQLASAQTAAGRTDAALATLAKAEAKFTTNFEGEFYTARAYSRAKDFTNAVNHFTRAEELAKSSTNRLNEYFYFEAGAANERKGDFDESAKYFEKALKLSPDMPEALNYYGYMLADRGIKLERARNMIEKAVQLDPKNAAYVDSLGWVLFKQGKKQDGLAQIQKAIQLSNTEPDATLYEHLGDIYAALNQPDKAREAWQKSIALEPSVSVQKKLDQTGAH